MTELIQVLKSGEFWAAVGALATIAGLILTWRWARKGRDVVQTGHNVDELADQKAFVEAEITAIAAARVAVSLCLHTVHASDANWKAQRVNAALVAAKKRGLTVRVLAGTGTGQLPGVYELQQLHDIELRLNPELLHSDLRFLKSDAHDIILGVADAVPGQDSYSPSHSWATLKTAALADALEREFQRLWLSKSSRDLFEVCTEYVSPLRDRIPVERLTMDLGIRDQAFMAQFYRRTTVPIPPNGETFIFHGKAGSGKSTLMQHIGRRTWWRALDLIHFVLPLVFRHGNENVVGDRIRDIYSHLIAQTREISYDLIETGSDFADYVLPSLFASVRQHGRVPVLVYCNLPLPDAQRRNLDRVRPVPLEILQKQDEEERRSTFRQLCADGKVRLLEITTGSPVASTLDQLLGVMGVLELRGS